MSKGKRIELKCELGVASKGNITSIRGLSDTEYEEYKKAVERLLRFSSDNQTFMIVWLNYNDYEKLLKRYFEEWKKNASMSWGRMENMALEINRRILNYLSSVRTFLDHSETNLKRRYMAGIPEESNVSKMLAPKPMIAVFHIGSYTC